MSEHTKGRLVAHKSALGHYLLNEKEDDVAFDIQEANARRLAACWNAFDGVSPPLVDCIADYGGVLLMLSEASRQERELNAARALLREALEGEKKSILHYEVEQRVRAYLDTCDKPEPT